MSERIPIIRTRKYQPSVKLWLYIVILLLGLLFLVMLFLKSPLCHVQSITVTGVDMVSRDDIISQSGIKRDDSLLNLDLDKIANHLKQELPKLKTVVLERVFPSRVEILVTEKKILGSIGKEMSLLEDGTTFQRSSNKASSKVPVLNGWTESDSQLREVAVGLAKIPEGLLTEFISVDRSGDNLDQLQIKTKRNHIIRVRIVDLAKKLPLYAKFLTHPAGELHLLETIWFTPTQKNKS